MEWKTHLSLPPNPRKRKKKKSFPRRSWSVVTLRGSWQHMSSPEEKNLHPKIEQSVMHRKTFHSKDCPDSRAPQLAAGSKSSARENLHHPDENGSLDPNHLSTRRWPVQNTCHPLVYLELWSMPGRGCLHDQLPTGILENCVSHKSSLVDNLHLGCICTHYWEKQAYPTGFHRRTRGDRLGSPDFSSLLPVFFWIFLLQ